MLDFNIGSFNVGTNSESYLDLSVTMSIDTEMYSRKTEGSSETDRGFGGLSFNSPSVYETRYQMNFGLDFTIPDVNLSIDSDITANPGFDLLMDGVSMSAETDMQVLMTRDLSPLITMSIDTDMLAPPAYYQQSYLELSGSFAPGDRIVIDASKLTVTKNGQNALYMLNGDFIELNLGPNQIQYSDDAAARNVLMRVTHRDRFI
ncbi:phage distal tail protein [Paenibacillus wenxiniae]|uniref:Siphovirus-type tail component C-terminal domain-containing protein n=1 Tax=Paenibacillus wenxiniae TaxID=1636843 RepID=A0ABW4RHF8_9BACL